MKVLVALALGFVSVAAHAETAKCRIVDNQSEMPMLTEMSSLELNAQGSWNLVVALAVPNENGGSNTATVAESFKSPSLSANGLSLKITPRPQSGADVVTAEIKGLGQTDWAGAVKLDVTMACKVQ